MDVPGAVFPAGAGVILDGSDASKELLGVSRRRGGDPRAKRFGIDLGGCFPQARG